MPAQHRTYLVKVITDDGVTTYPAIHAGAAEAIEEAMALFPASRTFGAKPMRTYTANPFTV